MRMNIAGLSIAMGLMISVASAPACAHLHPTLGRFVQRDPLVYTDGPNYYSDKALISLADWSGTLTCANACDLADSSTPTGPNHDQCPEGFQFVIAPDRSVRKCLKCKGGDNCHDPQVCRAFTKLSINPSGEQVYLPVCGCRTPTTQP